MCPLAVDLRALNAVFAALVRKPLGALRGREAGRRLARLDLRTLNPYAP